MIPFKRNNQNPQQNLKLHLITKEELRLVALEMDVGKL
jgi:hypothetical protein